MALNAQRISLCVPAYNASRVLPRLFASVQAQTEPFDEVWVYDDASSDDTAAVAAGFGARVVSGHANVGCSGGKNALLSHIDSEWVHFHDADDTLHPQFVERARRRIPEADFDLLLFDYEQVDEHSGLRISCSEFSKTTVLQDPTRYLLRETINNGGVYSTAMLRRLGGFDVDADVLFNEDRAFHLRLAEHGGRFAHEPYVASRFYFTGHSMSATNKLKCSLANQEITRRYARRHPDEHRREIGDQSWKNAGILASYLDWPAADAAVDLALASTGRIPGEGSLPFRSLCAINAHAAIRIREWMIRLFKPRYRQGYPQ